MIVSTVNRNGQLYSGYVCSGVCYGLLCLWDSGSKERHKATTRNGVPQGKGTCGGVSCKLTLCLVCCETDSACIVFV